MLNRSMIKYIATVVLILYGMTTFQMIMWTFKMEMLKERRTNRFGITFTELAKYDDDDNTTDINDMSQEEVALDTYSAENSKNSVTGRKREILDNLWKLYHQRKEQIRKSLIPIKFAPIDDNIMVLSVFYDNTIANKAPTAESNIEQNQEPNQESRNAIVRIVAISKTKTHDSLMCSFNIRQLNQWILADKAELSDGHDRPYGSFIYSCTVPETLNTIPTTVYLDSLENVDNTHRLAINIEIPDILKLTNNVISENTILDPQSKQNIMKNWMNSQYLPQQGRQLKNPNDTKPQSKLPPFSNKTLALCVPPIYGTIPISNLIQFIEIYRTLKVNHFFLYNLNISDKNMQILNYYVSAKVITILPWNIPETIKDNIWYYGQVVAINDCLYRTIQHGYELAAFVDLDEIIVPRKHQTLPEMIFDIERTLKSNTSQNDLTANRIAAFKFQSAFFNPDQLVIKEQQQSNSLSFLNALYRTVHTSSHRTKLIVKPRLIEHLSIHHVSKLLDDSDIIYNVPTDEALIHHYRPCVKTLDVDFDCKHTVLDDSIVKFEHKVGKGYESVIAEYIKQYKR